MTSWHDTLVHYEAVQLENARLREKVVKLETSLRRTLRYAKISSSLLDIPSERDRYVNAINSVYGIGELELKSPSRIKVVSEARQVLYFLLHDGLKMSTTQIGNFLNRDHTTVMHGIKVAPLHYQAKIDEVRRLMQ